MATRKRAVLPVVLAIILTIHAQVQQLECRTVTSGDGKSRSSSVEDEEERVSTSRWSSEPATQQRLIRSLRKRKLGGNGPVDRQDWFDHLSAKWTTFKTPRQTVTGIPVQQQLDLVERLPGQPNVTFAQYAGYVTVNETAGRALFYYFVEATSSPETKPLVLWLNGGPGCSSLGYGAFSELGPFRVNTDGATLSVNDDAWNTQANILFLESPAGVGFSYSNTSSDYITGDARTAADSLVFLLNWIERFPQYEFRDFYITGESYGGHYVPQLANALFQYNKKQTNVSIPLKGFMVGNGVTEAQQDGLGTADYLWSHALISDETHAALHKCLESANYPSCSFQEAYNEAYGQPSVDPYNIYGPICQNASSPGAKAVVVSEVAPTYNPCFSNFVTTYMTSPDVQKALHAADVTLLSEPWSLCNMNVNENWQDSAITVIPIYQELISAGLHIFVYSGDVDSVVPVTATRYSLGLLNLKVNQTWSAWNSNDNVGGWWVGYDGLTFVTVRGSGHEVPLFQPDRALAMFTSYINYLPLPGFN